MHTKHYTVKQWKKFPLRFQERLCSKYEIILTDHKTKKEKMDRIIDSITLTNLNKKIDTFQKYMNKMDSFWKKWDKIKNTNFLGDIGPTKQEYNILVGKSEKKDYSAILGKHTKKDYSFITGKRK